MTEHAARTRLLAVALFAGLLTLGTVTMPTPPWLSQAVAQTARAAAVVLARDTPWFADRYADAPSLGTLRANTSVEPLRSEGGWTQVRAEGKTGWVRASALPSAGAVVAQAAQVDSGRTQAQSGIVTTAVRGIPPPRASRHALIIGVGQYSDPAVSPLAGVALDMDSATLMALQMGVPQSNITVVRDLAATKSRIASEINQLNARVADGDRVFIYYSGHGTRWYDPSIREDTCVEALLASDRGTLTNDEMAALLKPIADKTDKLMVLYDACHSGGVVNEPMRTRSLNLGGEMLTPRFSPVGTAAQCAQPSNLRTRSLLGEQQKRGGLPENIVHIASSRNDEVSFDDPRRGGVATVAWRECMAGEARDLDRSGQISVEEIAACAQAKINARFANNPTQQPHNITITGNKGFVPALFAALAPQAPTAPTAAATPVAPVAAPAAPVAVPPASPPRPPQAPAPASPLVAAAPVAPPAAPPAPTPSPSPVAITVPAPPAAPAATATEPPGMGPQATINELLAQRDGRRRVDVALSRPALQIGRDSLDFRVTSSHAGHVYVGLLGSDQQSFYLLFPNDLDSNNQIAAGQTLQLPRANWRVTAGGPAGTNRMIVLVTESPRDVAALQAAGGAAKAGPFVRTLTTPEGRSNIGWFLTSSANADKPECRPSTRRNLVVAPVCSDAFGAAVVDVVER
jgi:hypothetical protein